MADKFFMEVKDKSLDGIFGATKFAEIKVGEIFVLKLVEKEFTDDIQRAAFTLCRLQLKAIPQRRIIS
jgi:hypothetical protein